MDIWTAVVLSSWLTFGSSSLMAIALFTLLGGRLPPLPKWQWMMFYIAPVCGLLPWFALLFAAWERQLDAKED